ACLRCGEVGHFRRDCLKNIDTGKQGAVKIGIIRRRAPYSDVSPVDGTTTVYPSDSDDSDMELYEEARIQDLDDYGLVPQEDDFFTDETSEPEDYDDSGVMDTSTSRKDEPEDDGVKHARLH